MFFLAPSRRRLIAPLKGLILEIGAGTGFSLSHYSPGVTVIATEPDLASVGRLAEKARKSVATVVPIAASAHDLPFGDCLFDGLVCQLALCTIPDPARALAEAKRVLKPGAPMRFLEHVRADRPWQAWMQDRLAPLWFKLAGGCRLNQDTERVVRDSGLHVELVVKRGGIFLPMKLIWVRN